MALSGARKTSQATSSVPNLLMETAPVKGGTTIYKGGITAISSAGYAIPGETAVGINVIGMALDTVANSGADGAQRIRVARGVFKYKNSGSSDVIGWSEVGKNCYLVDDETVAKTSGTATRSVAGIVDSVAADGGVWVRIGV